MDKQTADSIKKYIDDKLEKGRVAQCKAWEKKMKDLAKMQYDGWIKAIKNCK